MSKTLNGIAASDGFALASAYKLTAPTFNITNEQIRPKDVNKNLEFVENAFKMATSQLKAIELNAAAKIGEYQAKIFQAHIEILNDPTILEDIRHLIRNELCNPMHAVNTVFNATYEKFISMEDAYYRERSADIVDIKNRVLSVLTDSELPNLLSLDKSVIIIADDLSPSQTALLDKNYVKGFVTSMGGKTSHAAIIARTLEIPAILGIQTGLDSIQNGEIIAIDGTKGILHFDLTKTEMERLKSEEIVLAIDNSIDEYISKKAITTDGKEIDVCANIGKPSDLDNAIKHGAGGIGLFRTEFLYMDSHDWPTEEEQFAAYKEVVEKAKDQLVIIRTLDIGGDKMLPYYKFEYELNPFLGNRAVRFCLSQPNILKVQLRAILRAAAFGKIGIMFPMVTTLEELKRLKDFLLYCEMELKLEKVNTGKPLIGIMVETPATAMQADAFAKNVDFFSIGTNDLIQYTFAADRLSKSVNYLYQPMNPGLLRLIKYTVDGANKSSIWVGMCGEMASDFTAIPLLVGLNIKELSMIPSSITKAKKLICQLNYEACVKLVDQALNCESDIEVIKLVEDFLKANNISI
ncbi:phosphoenolpyruvate--protein phosphotransferase [Mycoplasmoides alvi]|uniref:phosphoenolpyruvate--protein phosphotransferase n=1 Tax=Mycoplasmoides alvi TaxID=78580 RepID=UPI00051BF74B|nr:phosphoenolpyruvate--protein phosphotransferase [Mycoplasmoides alvi]